MNYSNSGSNKYFTLVQDDKDSSEPQTPLPPAPALHLDSHRLFVECHHTCKQAVTLTLRNPDTAAVYFTWQPRMPRLHHRKLQVSRAQANKTRAFVLACQSGCILPGEAKLFHFLFAPPSPGMFTECWKLCTQPEASVPGGCEVTLRGTALTHDAGVLKRTQLQQHTSAEQKARQVACAVEHILRGINVPEAIHAPLSQSEWPEVHRFASGTVHIVPPVYFKPGVNKVLEELYTDVRASLVPQVDPKKKGKKAEKAVMPDIPEGFDGRVDTLMQCLEKLDTLGIDDPNAADKSKAIRNRLEEVLSAGSVPESLSVVYAHVARQLLVDLADVIEEVATSVAANREEARALQGHDNGAAAVLGGKAPDDSRKEKYDALLLAFKPCVRGALANWEPSVKSELEHIGRVLDKQIAASQQALRDAGSTKKTQGELVAHAWDSFSLLRKRRSFFVPTVPAPLLVPPRPIAFAL